MFLYIEIKCANQKLNKELLYSRNLIEILDCWKLISFCTDYFQCEQRSNFIVKLDMKKLTWNVFKET